MVYKKLIFLFLGALSTLSAQVGFHPPWGKDADLFEKKIVQQTSKTSFLMSAAETVIGFHQKVISPVDGPRSHFRPTSSRYMLLAMKKYGVAQGFIMGCDRLIRENDARWVYRTVVIDGKKYKSDLP